MSKFNSVRSIFSSANILSRNQVEAVYLICVHKHSQSEIMKMFEHLQRCSSRDSLIAVCLGEEDPQFVFDVSSRSNCELLVDSFVECSNATFISATNFVLSLGVQ